MYFYSNPKRETEKYALPDAETLYLKKYEMRLEEGRGFYRQGWYYWYSQVGCLPDSTPIGPFKTEQEAIDDAIEQNTEY